MTRISASSSCAGLRRMCSAIPILPMSWRRPPTSISLSSSADSLSARADGDGELGGALRVAGGVRILGLDGVDQRAQDLEVAALDGEQELAVVGVVLIELLRGFVEGARQLGDFGRPLDGNADAERAGGEAARALPSCATGRVMPRAKKNATTSDSASASAVQPPACAQVARARP